MSETRDKEEHDLAAIDGELVTDDEEVISLETESLPGVPAGARPALPGAGPADGNQRAWLTYVLLPALFLTVALLGGLRIAAGTSELVFLGPALICLIFATLTVVLFIRTGLIDIGGWFSESLPTLQNAANAAVLVSFFGASVQVYNSLIPEQGLPFWIVSFCFLWTLGVSFFTLADARQAVRSWVSLFAIAFLAKYFLLQNLTSTSEGNWLQRLWGDPTREAITYLLDLPRFAPSTGYIQFFCVGLFLLGLFLMPRRTS